MAREKTLSSDIDFIREFEELKIKQRLLIENLKKKGQSNQDKLFLEINSKLDFLVKIFKESNEPNVENNDEAVVQEDPIILRIEGLTKVFNDKFVSLEEKLDKLIANNKNAPITPSNPTFINPEDRSSSQLAAPKPDFEAKIDDVNKSTEKKSSKWF